MPKNQKQKNKSQEWEELAHVVWNAENEYHAKKILEDLGNRLIEAEREKVVKEIHEEVSVYSGINDVQTKALLKILNTLTKE